MKRLFALILIIALLCTSAPLSMAQGVQQAAPATGNFVANELIITQKTDVSSPAPLPLVRAEVLETDALEGESALRVLKGTVKYGTDIEALCEQLEKRADILSADPNYIQNIDTLDLPAEALKSGSDYNAFNWYKQSLQLNEAWQSAGTLGSDEVVVAVIDTGVNTAHKEFENALWDDGDGHCGYNAYDENYDVTDNDGHGSNVAGIIAMRANDFGYVGIAPQVKIMPLKATSTGGLTDDRILTCLNYAVENGADIINMSFSGSGLSDTMALAYQHAADKAVLVAAAGNDGYDAAIIPEYPAACSGVIGVMSYGTYTNAALTDYAIDNGELSSFSNYDSEGKYYQLAAPGISVAGPSHKNNSAFTFKSGTSQASPIVAGAAALYLSLHPQATPYQVRTALIEGSHQSVSGYYNENSYRRIDLQGVFSTPLCEDPELSLSAGALDILNRCLDTQLSTAHLSDLDALTLIPASAVRTHKNELSVLAELYTAQKIDLHRLSLTNEAMAWLQNASFPKLFLLDVSDNTALSALPFSKTTAPLLRELYADNCAFRNTADFEHLGNLYTLSMCENPLVFSAAFENLGSLRELALSDCRLQDVKSFAKLNHLVYLDISNNYITDISALACYRGAYLDISCNPLQLGAAQNMCIRSIQNFMNDNPYAYTSTEFLHDGIDAQDKEYCKATSITCESLYVPRIAQAAQLQPVISPADANVNTAIVYASENDSICVNAYTGKVSWQAETIAESIAAEIILSPTAAFASMNTTVHIEAPEVLEFSYENGTYRLIGNTAAESMRIGTLLLESYETVGNTHIFTVPDSLPYQSTLIATAYDTLGAGSSKTIAAAVQAETAKAKILSFTSDKAQYTPGETATLYVKANNFTNQIKLSDCTYDTTLFSDSYRQLSDGRVFSFSVPVSAAKSYRFKAYASADGNFGIGAKVLSFTAVQEATQLALASEIGSCLYFSAENDSLQAEALLYPDDAALGTQVHFRIEDETVATVDRAGNVQALAYGQTVLRAETDNGLQAALPIIVGAPKMSELDITEGYYDEYSLIKLYTKGASDIVLTNADGSAVDFEYECERTTSNIDGYDAKWLVALYTDSPEALNLRVYAVDDNGLNDSTRFRFASLTPITPAESFAFSQSSYRFERTGGAVKIKLNVQPEGTNDWFNWAISGNTVASLKAYADYVILTPRSSGTLTLTASKMIGGKEVSQTVPVTFTEGTIYKAQADNLSPECYESIQVQIKTDKSIRYVYLQDADSGLASEYSAYCYYEDDENYRYWSVPFAFKRESTSLRIWGGDSLGNLAEDNCIYLPINATLPESGIAANPSALGVQVGTTADFQLIQLPSRRTISYLNYSVSIEDETIASFSKGRVTALKEGETVMHCTYGEESKEVHILTYNPIQSLTLPESSLTLTEQESFILQPQAQPESLEPLLFESDNEQVACVNANGVLTALHEGSATITVRTKSGVSTALALQVKTADPVNALSFDAATYTLEAGKTLPYVLHSDAQSLLNKLHFESSNTNIVSVDTNGVFTAQKEGTVTVTASADNGVSASAQVTVTAERHLMLTKEYAEISEQNAFFLSTMIDPDGVNVDGYWFCDNTAVAVVSQEGYVSTKSAGTCTIYFISDRGEIATCFVKVNPIMLNRIAYEEAEISLKVNENRIINYTRIEEFASEQPKFYTSNSRIAQVDANGIIYGVSEGTAIITARLANGNAYPLSVQVTADRLTLSGNVNHAGTLQMSNVLGQTRQLPVEGSFALEEIVGGTYSLCLSAPHCTKIYIEDAKLLQNTDLGSLTLHNGDVNSDGVIDIGDISVLLAADTYATAAAAGAQTDVNDDGNITLADIAEILLAENYGAADEQLIF